MKNNIPNTHPTNCATKQDLALALSGLEERTDLKFARLERTIDRAIEELAGIIREFSVHVNERFSKVDERFDKVDRRFDKVEARLGILENHAAETNHRLARLEVRGDDTERRMRTLESYIPRITATEKKVKSHDTFLAEIKNRTLEVGSGRRSRM